MVRKVEEVDCGTKIIYRCDEEMEDSKVKISYNQLTKSSNNSITNDIEEMMVQRQISFKELINKSQKKEALL